MTSSVLLLMLAAIFDGHLTSGCSFPSTLHMNAKDPPWFSHVRADGSRDVEYYIRPSVMEVHYPRDDRQPVRWACSMEVHGKLMLKRQDHLVNSFYRCAKFAFRSRSVVQILWSHELKVFDLSLCDDLHLRLDPWPLIRFGTLEQDYSPCPFSGGFDMKIVDSQLGENGCNLMLRPMRMEAECLGGEGVTFNFVSSNCLPDIKMYVNQRTICVTDWQDERNHYVILRRNEEMDLWCLVMPVHRSRNVTAYLFSDLFCGYDSDKYSSQKDVKFFTLHLYSRVFTSLCQDEYDNCSNVLCNTHVKQECQKSCRMCTAESLPPACDYPRHFFGSWFLTDSFGLRNIAISASNISIDGLGTFLCVSYPNSPAKKSNTYTTISLFQNGCRPRYTCLKFHQLAPSVLQFSLSQSYVWPTIDADIGKSTCRVERFLPDSSPIDDRYRPHEGTGKPIISLPITESVNCNLTSVYTISATLTKGYVCPGSLYKHCDDPSKLRLEFGTCESLIPAYTDYKCLANFQGHYWERIILAQNGQDPTDVICFVFSQFYPFDAYVLVAGQCDQRSFNFARNGLRESILKLKLREEQESCKSVDLSSKQLGIMQGELASPDKSMRDDTGNDNPQNNMHPSGHGSHDRVSIASGSHAVKMGDSDSEDDSFSDVNISLEAPSAKSSSRDHAHLLNSGGSIGDLRAIAYVVIWTFFICDCVCVIV